MLATKDHLITSAARRLGVAPSTLRRWEDEGIIPPARRRRSYRVYSDAEIERIRELVFTDPKGDDDIQ